MGEWTSRHLPNWNFRASSGRPAGSCSWNGWTAWSPGNVWRSESGPLRPQGRERAVGPIRWAVMLRIPVCNSSTISATQAWRTCLYEAESVRRFVGLKLSGDLPDETTILNFRHLLESTAWRGPVAGDQRPPGVAGTAAQGGNHRGRQYHRGPVVDQEPCRGTGPGDASDEEREPVAFRAKFRGGRGHRSGTA